MLLFYLLSNLISNQPITHLSSRLQHIQKPIKGNQVSSTVNIYIHTIYIYIFQCFPPVHTRSFIFYLFLYIFLQCFPTAQYYIYICFSTVFLQCTHVLLYLYLFIFCIPFFTSNYCFPFTLQETRKPYIFQPSLCTRTINLL